MSNIVIEAFNAAFAPDGEGEDTPQKDWVSIVGSYTDARAVPVR